MKNIVYLTLIAKESKDDLFQEDDFHLDSRHLTVCSPPSGKFMMETVTEIYPQKNTSLEVLLGFYTYVQSSYIICTNLYLSCISFPLFLCSSIFSCLNAGALQVFWEFLHAMWSRGISENYILSGVAFKWCWYFRFDFVSSELFVDTYMQH